MESDGKLEASRMENIRPDEPKVIRMNGFVGQDDTINGSAPNLVNSYSQQARKNSEDKENQVALKTVSKLSGLKQGRGIKICGILTETAKRAKFQLQTDEGDDCNILFMMRVLVPEQAVLCNAYLYESWGAAEWFARDNLFPFYPGRSFTIQILVTPDYFSVTVNDKAIINFGHRAIAKKSTHLVYEGDVRSIKVECPMTLELPYIFQEPAGFRAGHEVSLDIRPWSSAKQFQILIGAKHKSMYAGFLAQIVFEDDIVIVKCHSFLNDEQGEEIKIDGHLPIYRNHVLELQLIIHQEKIEVILDGDYFADYSHKLPVEKLSHITVDGDISLYALNVKRPRGNWSALKQSGCCQCCEKCVLM